MALLATESRRRTWAHLMRQRDAIPGDVTKEVLRDAIDAADQWVEDAFANYRAALPSAFTSRASRAQAFGVLVFVVMRRANKLRTEED